MGELWRVLFGSKPKAIRAPSAWARFGELMEKMERENMRFLVGRWSEARVVILSNVVHH
jgi:hypothetical protein